MSDLEAFDIVRVLAILTFGVGVGFMVMTNVIAFNVLRPPKKLGFLWWHVASISLSWLLVGGASTFVVAARLGQEPSWFSIAVVPGLTLFMVAQVIIFSVERSRLLAKKALERATARSAGRLM